MDNLAYDDVLQVVIDAVDYSLVDAFEQANRSRQFPSPEHRLMFAVLEDALLLLINGAPKNRVTHNTTRGSFDRLQQELFHDTKEWFRSTDSDYAFSFENVWATLFPGWPVERARRAILRNPVGVRKRLEKIRRTQ